MLSSAASIKNMDETKSYAAKSFLNKSTVTAEEILITVREALTPPSHNPLISAIENQ
jgi:hypothetical protein